MSDQADMPRNKDEMIARINDAWDELERSLTGMSETRLTVPRDAGGWSAKDHLAHLAAWERSMLVLVRDRQPRYVGLGVDQALYDAGDEDAVNARMQANTRNHPLEEVQADRSNVHQEMMDVLATISEDDLMKPCSHYVAGASEHPVYGLVNGTTWGHFDMHRPWIVDIAGGAS